MNNITFDTFSEMKEMLEKIEQIRSNEKVLNIAIFVSVGGYLSARFVTRDLKEIQLLKGHKDDDYKIIVKEVGEDEYI